ncbi:MAG: hypothetical protein AAFX79_09265 [Planctomycetota bacterium]
MGKAVAILVGYAIAVVAMGVIAFALAPAQANAKTALIVPAAIAVLSLLCAGMAALLSVAKPIGMIGIHLGILLPLVVGIGVGQRAWVSHQASADYRETEQAWTDAVATGDQPDDADARLAYFEAADATPYDKAYLRNALAVIALVSLAAFVAMLAARPRPADRGPTPDAVAAEGGDGGT